MENKVIQFPKENSIRKRLLDKGQEQKAIAAVSIASVLIVSLFLNNFMVSYNSKHQDADRGIASVDKEVTTKQLGWEHNLAKTIEISKDIKAISAKEPTLTDQLLYGALEGKYSITMNDGKINEIHFNEKQLGAQPVSIADKIVFLHKYKNLFIDGDLQITARSDDNPAQSTYELFDSNKSKVGEIKFQLSSEGLVESLTVIK